MCCYKLVGFRSIMDLRYFITSILIVVVSCSRLPLDVRSDGYDVVVEVISPVKPPYYMNIDWAESEGERTVLRRAAQIALIQWTPLKDVPNNIGFFSAGKTVTGIPYSSTKQINKYVGLDVSFHTFMTAVHDPYSVLYTENLGKEPYNGVNCACYYGVVCSTALCYAFDFGVPYVASRFPEIDGIEKIEPFDINYLKTGDILQNSNHVFMIFRISKKPDGTVDFFNLFEASGTKAGLKTCSLESLCERIDKDGLTAYRYKNIDKVSNYEPSQYIRIEQEPPKVVSYNNELCPNRGDCSVYRTDDPVIIDVLDGSYKEIVLEQNDVELYCEPITGNQNDLGTLLPGFYKAYLRDGTRKSESVDFLVAEPIVSVNLTDKVHFDFSCSQGQPLYCVITNNVGAFKSTYRFTEEDIKRGYVDLDPIKGGPYYYKVVFQTPFGTVINNPIFVD